MLEGVQQSGRSNGDDFPFSRGDSRELYHRVPDGG
jgi:hypothetical protein